MPSIKALLVQALVCTKMNNPSITFGARSLGYFLKLQMIWMYIVFVFAVSVLISGTVDDSLWLFDLFFFSCYWMQQSILGEHKNYHPCNRCALPLHYWHKNSQVCLTPFYFLIRQSITCTIKPLSHFLCKPSGQVTGDNSWCLWFTEVGIHLPFT